MFSILGMWVTHELKLSTRADQTMRRLFSALAVVAGWIKVQMMKQFVLRSLLGEIMGNRYRHVTILDSLVCVVTGTDG